MCTKNKTKEKVANRECQKSIHKLNNLTAKTQERRKISLNGVLRKKKTDYRCADNQRSKYILTYLNGFKDCMRMFGNKIDNNKTTIELKLECH